MGVCACMHMCVCACMRVCMLAYMDIIVAYACIQYIDCTHTCSHLVVDKCVGAQFHSFTVSQILSLQFLILYGCRLSVED